MRQADYLKKNRKETIMYGYFTLFGRLLLVVLFSGSALGMINDPTGTQYFMAAYGLPFVGVLMWATVAILLASALCLLLGWQTRWAALTLAVWLIPVTFTFHMQWSDPIQLHTFMENFGLMGALIYISGAGAGAFSLDQRRNVAAGSRRDISLSSPSPLPVAGRADAPELR
jgi:putative oxidoreductase